MEGLRSLIPVVILAAMGCTSLKSVSIRSLSDKVEVALELKEPPPPATEFACTWQPRLQQLPDPTRGGAMITGIVGQAFVFLPIPEQALAPIEAEITGELTVMVCDAAPNSALKPEVWHFDKSTLKKLIAHDERFGRSIALFLPWPPGWKDVNRLTIQARYDQPNSHPLYAMPTTLTLDSSTNGTTMIGSSSTVNGPQTAVPDPKLLRQNQLAPVTPVEHRR